MQVFLHTFRDSSKVGSNTQRGLPTARKAGLPLARTSAGKLQGTEESELAYADMTKLLLAIRGSPVHNTFLLLRITP